MIVPKRDYLVLFVIASVLGYLYLPFWEDQNLQQTVRYTTVLFMVCSFYLFSTALARAWDRMWRYLRRAAIWIYLILAVGIWRTLEAMEQDAPIGPANYAVLATMVGFTCALFMRFENDFTTARIYKFNRYKETA